MGLDIGICNKERDKHPTLDIPRYSNIREFLALIHDMKTVPIIPYEGPYSAEPVWRIKDEDWDPLIEKIKATFEYNIEAWVEICEIMKHDTEYGFYTSY